jgi:hypothetical protein
MATIPRGIIEIASRMLTIITLRIQAASTHCLRVAVGVSPAVEGARPAPRFHFGWGTVCGCTQDPCSFA